MDFESEPNPFKLPSDEEVFRLRETERKEKEELRQRRASQKVWEKSTGSSRMGMTMRVADDIPAANDGAVSKKSKQMRSLVAAATAAISNDRRREKENMTDFIAKKREMFLVQMSLDTKRDVRALRSAAARGVAGAFLGL